MRTAPLVHICGAIGLLAVFLAFTPHVEVPASATRLIFAVNSTVDAPDASPGDAICATIAGQCTLRAAVQEANMLPTGSVVNVLVPSGMYILTMGPLVLTSNSITIAGAMSSTTLINGNDGSTVMVISNTVWASLRNITITGGNGGDGTGGGILNQGMLTVSQSEIVSNTVETLGGSGGGGGIYNTGTLTLMNSNVGNNSLQGNGSISGAGVFSSGTLVVINSSFSGNSTPNESNAAGGGIDNVGIATIANTSLSGNSTGGDGGGIVNGGTLTVTNSSLTGNIASGGGGLFNDGIVTAINTIFSGNVTTDSSSGYGGGISDDWPGINNTCMVALLNSTLIGNSATNSGGGIYNRWGCLTTVVNSTLSNNSALGSLRDNGGGGIYNVGMLAVTSSTLSSNSVPNGTQSSMGGGGIFNSGTVTVTNSTVNDNSVTDSGLNKISGGGGILNGATATVINSTFSGNAATNIGDGTSYGGGILNGSVMMTVTNSTLSDNSATEGSDIYDFQNVGTTLHGTIVANGVNGPNCSGLIRDEGYDLDSGTTCAFSETTDFTNTAPLLGPLANNSGPTRTMALLPGSLAIDHGGTLATGCSTIDQRGYVRPDEGESQCDLGAYETGAAPATLAISPNTGFYRQSVVLAGANFGAAETVNIYGDQIGSVPIYTTTANLNGAFVVTRTVLQAPFGPHVLTAVGQTSGVTATTTFSETPVLLLTPASGTTGSRTVVTGYGFGKREAVALHWDTPSGLMLGTVTSNVYGSFAGVGAIIIVVPPNAKAGRHLIFAVGGSSHAIMAAKFMVQ